MDIYAVILAGGLGTRLWPLSRRMYPKQFLALSTDGHTLIQDVVYRAKAITGSYEQVLLVTQAPQRELVSNQLPEVPPENCLIEPVGKNTAAAIGLAAIHIQERSSNAVMLVLPADHIYTDTDDWQYAIQTALQVAESTDNLVIIGIQPVFPATNYGYIKLGQQIPLRSQLPVFQVEKFFEKPDQEQARFYHESKGYLWNTGTFAWKTSIILENIRTFLPDLFEKLMYMKENLASQEHLVSIYPSLTNISIDFAILEKASQRAVVQADFQRIDVGSLAELGKIWQKDKSGNAGIGLVLTRDSHDNIYYSDDGLVGLIGVKDLIIIKHGDVVLICPQARAAEVKELVVELTTRKLDKFL